MEIWEQKHELSDQQHTGSSAAKDRRSTLSPQSGTLDGVQVIGFGFMPKLGLREPLGLGPRQGGTSCRPVLAWRISFGFLSGTPAMWLGGRTWALRGKKTIACVVDRDLAAHRKADYSLVLCYVTVGMLASALA